MSATVEVTDQFGGYIRSTKEEVTNLIHVEIYNGFTGEKTETRVDPRDSAVLYWLASVYQAIHLDILLGR